MSNCLSRKIGDAEDDTEVDFMIYVNQAQYEMKYLKIIRYIFYPSWYLECTKSSFIAVLVVQRLPLSTWI